MLPDEPSTPRLAPAELALLRLLWQTPGATIRQLTEAAYGRHTAALHATVQSLLERLEIKGLVSRQRTAPAHTYSARVEQSQLLDAELLRLAATYTGGDFLPLLTVLLDRLPLTRHARESVLQLVAGRPPV